MPYKYDNQKLKKYYIDYNSLYNELVHNPAFTAYDKYIEQQLNNLLKLEAKPIVYPLKFNDKFYCHKFSIGLSELFITFNITYIERFITDIKHLMHTLDIRNFGIKNSSIIYTEEPYEDEHLKSTHPVIIAPFSTNSTSEYIVLDGNHRISAKKQNNINYVNCYTHKPEKTFEFCFEYDRILYLFITELVHSLKNKH